MVGTDNEAKSMDNSKGALTTAKALHTRLCNKLVNACAKDSENQDPEYMSNLYNRVGLQFDKLMEALIEHVEATGANEEEQMAKNSDLHEEALELYFKYKSKLSKTANKSSNSSDSIPKPKVTLPEMKPFSAKIRDYPNFKSTFRKRYEPYYGDLAAVILKDKLLEGKCAQSCKSFETVEEIFKCLDKTYGDPGKLAESVLKDLANLKPCSENSVDDLKDLLQSVRCAEADLKAVKLEAHIQQYHTMTVIMDKLPFEIRKRWASEVARKGISTEERYEKNLEFLDLEISSMEFLDAVSSISCSSKPPDSGVPSSGTGLASRYASNSHGQKSVQSHQNTCVFHPDLRHPLGKCREFRRYKTEDQVKFLEQNSKICRSCLEIHAGSECPKEIFPCRREECGKRHYEFLHAACATLSAKDLNPHAYTTRVMSVETSLNSISPGQRIRVANQKGAIGRINGLYDSGSNISLILKSVCDHFGFKVSSETKTELNLEIVGGSSYSVTAQLYCVPLYNLKNKEAIQIHAYAVPKIGNELSPVNFSEAFKIFNIPPPEQGDMLYPCGDIELLMGSDNAHVILHHVTEINGLRLSESMLGRVIWGYHPSFSSTPRTRAIIVRKEHRTGRPDLVVSVKEDMVPALFSTDVMGVQCTPNCGGCACGKCSVNGDTMTPQERFEYDQIKESITVQNGIITASYPLCKSLSTLSDNYDLAYRRLRNTEQQLLKDPKTAGIYQEQIDDMLLRQVLRKLTVQEITEWDGPVQYLPHHIVYKLTSTSTPARLVFDPSSSQRGCKPVNQYWGRGPCILNSQFDVLLRFRENQVAILGDISKMYNTVHTRPSEWHLHRVLWRNLDMSKKPDIYAIVRNSFGSGPAGTVAIAAKDYLAELKESEYPRAADSIKNQAYVDDILDSVASRPEAEKLTHDIDHVLGLGSFKIKKWTIVNSPESRSMAECSTSAEPRAIRQKGDESMVVTKSIEIGEPYHLTQTNESVEFIEPTQTKISLNGDEEAVLGISWDTKTDQFLFKTRLNFSKRKKKMRTGPDLEPGQILDVNFVPNFTRRTILSQVHGLYDILGQLAPFNTELKFSLGKLWRINDTKIVDWDEKVPDDHDALWRKLFELFFEIRNLRFPRCISPANPDGKPILVMFSDSSMIAFATVAYIWWSGPGNAFFSRLLTSKTRMWPIAPDDYISVERGELQGAVLSKRLSASNLKASRFEFEEVVFVIDSEIVFSQIRMDSHLFNTFVGSRIAEIRSSTNPDQWYLAKSEDNVCADLASRGTTDITLLDADSAWQNGPEWMQQPRTQWPIYQTTRANQKITELRCQDLHKRVLFVQVTNSSPVIEPVSDEIIARVYTMIQQIGEAKLQDPGENVLKTFRPSQEDYIASLIDLTRHDSLDLWLSVTFRVLRALSNPDEQFLRTLATNDLVLPEQRKQALNFWIRQAQRPLRDLIKKRQYKTLTPFEDETGIIRVNGRFPQTYDAYQPILLTHAHPLARLIVIQYHRRGHSGAVATAAKVRAEYHIIQLRSLAKKIRSNCTLCRLREHRLLRVPMAKLPSTRIRPSFAFEHISLDLAGPFGVLIPLKETRNRRIEPAYYKAYVLVITCMSTRAVHFGVMQGCNTDAFLLAFRTFACIRGQPKSCWSDNGGQIISADKDLKQIVEGLDDTRIQQYGAQNGTKFEFASPGSPWQNGVSEALIRSLKTTLSKVLTPDTKLPILELQTILCEVAELLNERPISLGHQGASGDDFDAETSTYICPNQLLLGRSTVKIPAGPFQPVPLSHKNRLLANQTLVTKWWTEWAAQYLPQLLAQSKWYDGSRPARLGDIVHVKDINPIRGDWKIGEIMEIKDNKDKIPRNALIRYMVTKNSYSREYQPGQSRTHWRDVKNICLILPVEERSELSQNSI